MAELDIIRQGEIVLYPDLVFNRPVNPVSQPIVSLVGGNVTGIKPLDQAYTVAAGLGSRVDLLTTAQVAGAVRELSAGWPPHVFDPADRAATHELWHQIETGSSLAAVGIDLPLSSTVQVRLEELLQLSSVPLIVTGQALRLFATNPGLLQKPNLVLCCDTIELMRLCNDVRVPARLVAQRGIYGIVDLIQKLAEQVTGLKIAAFDAENLLIYDHRDPNQIGLLHINGDWYDGRGLIYGALAGMLSWPLRSLDKYLPRAMNAAYVLRRLVVDEKTDRDLNAHVKRIYAQIT